MGGALLTRRRRAAFASTYASSGGIVYTVFQVGCAAALILIGLGIVVVILVSRT
jgi:NADH:ubiquinone oxidoreductase subunit K